MISGGKDINNSFDSSRGKLMSRSRISNMGSSQSIPTWFSCGYIWIFLMCRQPCNPALLTLRDLLMIDGSKDIRRDFGMSHVKGYGGSNNGSGTQSIPT